jgi:hypothetical protein
MSLNILWLLWPQTYNIVDDVMININPLYDKIRYQISLFVILIFEIYICNVNC